MKSILAFILLFSTPAFAQSFTAQENQILRSILHSIRPIEVADSIYCSLSKDSMPNPNPVIYCGVDYWDPSRRLAKFRTKWISSRVLNLLEKHGTCGYVDRANTGARPYVCQLSKVRCSTAGCTAE